MADPQTPRPSIWEQIRTQLLSLQAHQELRHSDPEALAEKLARRAQLFRERIQTAQNSEPVLPVVLFSIQQVRYGLPLHSVVEIQQLQSFSTVPRGPDFLYGVVHFQGAILALFNLAGLLRSPQRGIGDIHLYLVAQEAGRRVAIAAEDVEDLKMIPISEIKTAPEWDERIPSHWVRGVYQEDCLILQLDVMLSDDAVEQWNGGGPVSRTES